MDPSRFRLPRLSAGRWLTLAVIAFIVIAVFFDTITSLKEVRSGDGPPQAQLNGVMPQAKLVVGQASTLTFALDDISGGAMSPACVGGNLTPEFRVLKVTFLGTAAGRWADNRSCAGIVETNATVPVVITVVPLRAGTYTVKLYPQVGRKRTGRGTSGEIAVVA
ncbi:MAG: hypothetical protein ACREOL_02490 [Candidatus Dormibacteria bacterium]